ncbi:hypothetical protein BC936DRAFT_145944 [Jimgerdemannia flammicorona]|uniref:Methyltransferase type 11 domain-containing protein n=1 Tax=Jimgerdemannia flammicorona TaxID=994334 RepID=A0A433D8Q9_9FUNG|nr:hypothetical protein BC936DRAFT_145944 [Jimgerdemannia flammicorona]
MAPFQLRLWHLVRRDRYVPLFERISGRSDLFLMKFSDRVTLPIPAKAFPNATIYGIDTIAHFETKDVPDNCYIQVADASYTCHRNFTLALTRFYRAMNAALDLPFEESTFDFIFMRGLIFDIKALNYKELVTNMVTLLKPGGYIELNEQDVRLRNAGPITAKFIDLETMAFDTEGFDSRLTRRMHKFLVRDSRITDVKTTFYSIPVGKQWAEPVAGLAAADLLREYRGKREWVAPRVGIDLTDYDDIVDSVKREFMTAETTYVNYRIVYGRKIANVERNPSMKGANSTKLQGLVRL